MPWLDLISYFFGGAFLANAVPHLVSGMMGRPFQSPFAKPPGQGLSSSTANVVWGFFNLGVGYVLVCRVGEFDLREGLDAAALGLGMFLVALITARLFGRFNGGNAPAQIGARRPIPGQGLPVVAAILVVSASATIAHADEKPWEQEGVESDVQGVCRRHELLSLPVGDLPDDAERATLKGCSSRSLYYGIGGRPDYAAARKCAILERNQGSDANLGPVSGSAILMMIYANGLAVPKNLDLGIKMACEAGFAPAEVTGRVRHLEKLTGKIDICDDITSGYMMGFCTAIGSDLAAAKNAIRMNQVVGAWPESDRASFDDLRRAADAYFEAHSTKELDLSGTARAAFSIGEKDTMRKRFWAAVVRFEAGNFPITPPNGFAIADKNLNATYNVVLRKNFTDITGISKNSIRETEIAWIQYRDAWTRFAAIRYPTANPEGFKTWLTQERTKTLKEIPAE